MAANRLEDVRDLVSAETHIPHPKADTGDHLHSCPPLRDRRRPNISHLTKVSTICARPHTGPIGLAQIAEFPPSLDHETRTVGTTFVLPSHAYAYLWNQDAVLPF